MLIDESFQPSHRSTAPSRGVRGTAMTLALGLAVACVGLAPAAGQDPKRSWSEAERTAILQKNADLQALVHKLRKQKTRVVTDPSDPARSSRHSPESTPEDREPEPGERMVVVREGDSLAMLAKKHLGAIKHVDQIRRFNPGLDPTKLRVGDRIRLPARKARPDPISLPASPGRAVRRAGTRPGEFAQRGTLDLVDRVIEARTQLELAEIELARAQSGRADAGPAKVKLNAAHKRWDLMRRAIEFEMLEAKGQLRAREDELKYSAKLLKAGFIKSSELRASKLGVERAMLRLDLLKRSLK